MATSAASLTPTQALRELITILDIEKNHYNSTQQIKKALSKAKEFLPSFEEWENSYSYIDNENEELRKNVQSKEAKLEETTKLLNLQKTFSSQLSQRSKTTRGLEEEIRELRNREEIWKKSSEDLKKATEEQLQTIIKLLQELKQYTETEKAQPRKEETGKQTSRQEEDHEHHEEAEKDKRKKNEEEWKTVEKKKRKEDYRLFVRGKGRQRLTAPVIRKRIDEVIRKQNLRVTSLKWAKNEDWSVVIVMTCALELVQLADHLNAEDLHVTHTRIPPPQLVISSREKAQNIRIFNAVYDTLKEEGIREPVPMTINGIRGRRGWHTWSLRISDKMANILEDKGRFKSGVQTFYVRKFLYVPQCNRCLKYGHDTCSEKPCCFKCGSEEHQARTCEVIPDQCIPCYKEGLESRHRGTRYCGSYKKELDRIRGTSQQEKR